MGFGIPTVETGARENRKNVITNILTVQGLRERGLDGVRALEVSSGILGRAILNDLPESVRSFTYSRELPNVAAIRDTGVEGWNATRALDWALEGQTEGVRKGLLESVGEIL